LERVLKISTFTHRRINMAKGKKMYRSMRGKAVDMDLLTKKNELVPAVGNAKVNARGDELGPGGVILRKREDIVKEYYSQVGSSKRPKPTADVETEEAVEETVVEKPKAARTTKKSATPAEVAAEEAALDDQEEWVEDEDGNFVKKGA
jgi:hypothetical protein